MKIICIGLNYQEHAKEMNSPLPQYPLFFMKPDTALLIRNRPFFIPDFSNEIHHEIELVVRINKIGKHIQKKFAHKYYNQIALGVDFTARDLQNQCKKNGHPWEISKAFDFSAAISDFIPLNGDIQNQTIELKINGKTKQKTNTKDMIFSVDKIIEYVSQFVTLKIGDLIYTGTPSGVGQVKIGDQLQASLNELELLNFQIK